MEAYERLEGEFSRWSGCDDVVCVNSGTAALHIALEALRLPSNSEVILCDFNMVACARAVTLAGLKPVFVDCNEKLLIDPEKISEYVEDNRWRHPVVCNKDNRYFTSGISAILCTHIYGRACDMQAIHDVAAKYDLRVIEDLAEAHGVPPHPNTDASCYSFYKNKIIAGEEGGAVAFKNPYHADTARCLRSLGFTDAHDYTHIARGHNYRLANCLAKKVIYSLHSYQKNRLDRELIQYHYETHCPPEWKMMERDAVWVYDIRIKGMTSEQQTRIVKKLRSEGIEGRHSFKPMSTLEEYRTDRIVNPLSQRFSREIIYLPVQPGITIEEDCRRAFEIIKTTL